MKFINKIAYTVLAFILIFGGIKAVLEGIGILENSEMKLCQELVATGGNAIATYDLANSKEKTTTYRKIGIATEYELVYTFEVNGKTYKGTQLTRNLPESQMTRVMYRKSDPNKNYIRPAERLEELKNFSESNKGIWFGLGAFFIGVLILGVRIKEFLGYRKSKSDKKKTKDAIFSVADKTTDSASKLNKSVKADKPILSSRFSKKTGPSVKEKREEKRNETRSQKRSRPDVPKTISRNDLLAKSQKTFKETDHSRFMPSSMKFHSEEE